MLLMASALKCQNLIWNLQILTTLMFLLLSVHAQLQGRKTDSRSLVEDLKDHKEFRKLLRTKNNVLIIFLKSTKSAPQINSIFPVVAEEVKGQATLSVVDCSGEGKKLCKKLKVTPEPFALKHYKDGEFHKDYDRKETIQSMVNFLKDPSGDAPWDEDENSKDVVHVTDASALGKLLHKEKLGIMVMFYVPWCGYCKRLKPDYASAATELKNQAVMAAMDVNKAENAIVRRHFNISGFPTLLYFENGNLKYKYDGENTKDDLVKFMKSPGKLPEKPKEEEWSETESDVVHLTVETFDQVLKAQSSVLIMFYAPWCGHCKKMKPEYVDAAHKMKLANIPGILAAIDATKEKSLGERFKITGYPSVKYFKNGEYAFDANVRTADKIVEFMKDPKEPPPPPPPEAAWHEVPSDVVHLDEENFKPFLKRKKHVLVMFYAPWCGHCKRAKPEYQNAAAVFKDDPKVELAAVDCTVHSSVCSAYEVQGYPTFRYYNYLKNSKPYEGGRNEADFVSFMRGVVDPSQAQATTTPPPPPPDPKEWWSEFPGNENLHHLNSQNFDAILQKEDSVLVMFYAQWCGHCKNLKPAYSEAASKLISEKIPGKLATVDAVAERDLASKYGIQGFPTIKYFKKGKFVKDYSQRRTVEDLVNFMKVESTVKEEL